MTRRIRTMVALVALLGLVASACWGGDDQAEPEPDDDVVAQGAGEGPIRLLLSQGNRSADVEALPVVDGNPLSAARLAEIFARLDALPEEDDDRQAFNRPPQTLAPPIVGATIEQVFGEAQAAARPAVPGGPLEVLRVQPEGDVEVAPFLSVTFNQPMIPLATLDQLDQTDVPIRITPELDGRWRWIGTRTLRFEHSSEAIDRLPMATSFTVEIPAGTTSETGGVLADDVFFRFETPAPRVLDLSPSGESIRTRPVFVAVFDQRVEPEAVLESITLKASGDRAVRLATDGEIAADDSARRIVARGLDGRVVAFTPVEALPTDTGLEVVFEEGTPSAEGPNTTTDDQTFKGRTYGPFEIREARCGYDRDACRPGTAFSFELTNPIRSDSFDPSEFTISPEVGMQVANYGNVVEVFADTAADTDYEVTLPETLRDEFGQRLRGDRSRSFDVGDALPALQQIDQELVTLDPYAETPSISVVSIGHDELKVELYEVDPDPADFEQFTRQRYDDDAPSPPGRRVSETTVEVVGDGKKRTETRIDLTPVLGDDPGHVIAVVSPTQSFPRDSEAYWQNRPVQVWAQRTDLGVDAFANVDDFFVWVTDLRDGTPVDGAAVRTFDGGSASSSTATTEDGGLARLPDDQRSEQRLVLVQSGDDVALLPSWWCCPDERRDTTRFYVFDDRGLYRPGETVRVKGWARTLTLSEGPDARLVAVEPGQSVRYSVMDSVGNEVATGETTIGDQGGFDVAFDLPGGINLGPAWMEIVVAGGQNGASTNHQFQVQEFRRPDFEVSARAESPGPHVFTAPVTLAATAEYFAGGPLPDAPVVWTVSQTESSYSPPNWSEFSFGVWKPWWYDSPFGGGFAAEFSRDFGGDVVYEGDYCCEPPFGETETERLDGRTDASGTHYLQIDFSGAAPDQPLTVTANAAVEDVNRQSFAGNTDLLVHSGRWYVGLRGERTFVREGEPLEIEAVLVDVDGNSVADQELTITAARLETQFVDGSWEEVPVDEQTCTVTSGTDPAPCQFTTDTGGTYRIASTVTDPDGGQNRTEYTRWVQGGDAVPARTVEQEQLTLVPDAREYAPGDTAEVLVQAPFTEGHGIAHVIRNGVAERIEFSLDDAGAAVVPLSIDESMYPGVDVRIDVVGAAERLLDDGTSDPDLPPRPAFATGGLTLSIPPYARTLDVTVSPASEFVTPGSDTSVSISVADTAGAPVAGSEVALVVVDEAVLSLTGYTLADPMAVFYGGFFDDLWHQAGRQFLRLTNPVELLGAGESAPVTTTAPALARTDAATGGAGSGDDSAEEAAFDSDGADLAAPSAPTAGASTAQRAATEPPIAERTDFSALAAFVPSVITGPDGTATVPVSLPDNLTRYRIMAVAVSGADRFGSGEGTVTAGLPISVRPSAPRFANFGDTFELPLVIQNRSGDAATVEVALEATNLTVTDATGGNQAGKVVDVPAGDRVEVRFPVAAEDAGTARFRAVVVQGPNADAATGELPVYTPSTSEAFATYGTIDDGAIAQPVLTPTGVIPQFGQLEVTTSSTAVQALTDALLYLQTYPYDSTDAYASRIIAVSALYDILDAFDVDDLPSRSEMEATMKTDLQSLAQLQNPDGGWPVWSRFRETVPYHSIQATHALVAAQAAGLVVPEETLQQGLGYLRDIESRYPSDYSQETRWALSAYALHVRDLAGDRDPAKAEKLYRDADLQLDAVAWLWPIVDDAGLRSEIARTFANRVTETPSAATFTTDYGEDAYLVLASDRRTDGIVLDALIRIDSENDLIPKVVQGLIGNQQKGRWNNVQENAFILLSLKRYFDTFESVTPDFVARVWLGDLYAAEHPYQGRSIDSTRSAVPMAELLERDDPDLVLQKDGAGRLYYRLGLTYAPSDLTLDPRDEGFVVERRYEPVTNPDDVVRNDDGTWTIRAGAEVRVRLTMVADSRRTNVALVDHLPAGLEIVNPDLVASPALPPEPVEPIDEGDFDEGDAIRPVEEPGFGDFGGIGYLGDSYFPWYGTWYEHQNLRDDRAEAFTAWLGAGTYEYTYVARATTPGTFVVPPPKAEEIYSPEVFGRGASATVTIG